MLSCKPYKGVRDFPPEKKRIHDYILSVMEQTAKSFGYEKYDASILEHTELYLDKEAENEEIINEQTYTFKDRKGRSITLRPEMTPTLARMIACNLSNIVLPARWYSIPNCFRYERPQKGRLREFWQLNVDIIGDDSVYSDAEIIQIAYQIMKNYGVEDKYFQIHLNDRSVLEEIFAKLSLQQKKQEILKILDRKNKIPKDEFDKQMQELLKDKTEQFFSELENAQHKRISQLQKILSEIGIKNTVLDHSIVRGFNYYTGMIFEIFDSSGELKRSLFGGGRYDRLLSLFSKKAIPAVGFGMGDVAIEEFLLKLNLLPELKGGPYVVIGLLEKSDSEYAQASKLADMLREKGISVFIDYSSSALSKKLTKATKKNTRYFIALGEQEINTQKYTLKDLKNSQTYSDLSAEELVNKITS